MNLASRLFLCSGLLLFFACSGNHDQTDEQPPLDKETFTSLLTDLQLAETIIQEKQNRNPDTLNYKAYYYEGIFRKYGTDPATFDSTMSYYRHHLDELELIYKDVVERLSRMQGADPAK